MKVVSFIILLFFSSVVAAQEVQFSASAPSVVELGEQFRLAFSINRQGSNLQVPTLEGFDLLMGPSTSSSSSVSIVNGVATQHSSYTYTYILEGVKEGAYQIPSATITVDGKQYKSNPLKIQVVKGSGNSGGRQEGSQGGNRAAQPDTKAAVNESNLFVTVEPSRRSLYLGESLVATIKVYTKVSLVGFGRNNFPSFDGFLAEDIQMPQQIELSRTTYDGQIYNVGIIRKILLFPQHMGEITIGSFELEAIVRQQLSSGRSPFDDFFGNYRDVKALRKSQPLTITVKELPQAGKPLGFSGMVGNVSMSSSISADTVNANDALTYKLTFRGAGNLKLLHAPSVSFPHDFEVYDPKENKDIKTGENGMSGEVTFEYLVIPRYSGDYKIPALNFSFFDPQTNTYKTLSSKEYDVHVRKGSDKAQGGAGGGIQSFKKEDVRMVGEDIRYLKTGDLNLHDKGARFFGTLLYWLVLVALFLLFVIGAVVNRRRIQANADLVRVKNKAANKMARKRMKVAAGAMKNQNGELFYEEVLKALWGYVSYKLNIDKAELNRDNINDILLQKSVDPAVIQEFITVLDTCEYARYAPGSRENQEMDKVYKDSIIVITKLDKVIR